MKKIRTKRGQAPLEIQPMPPRAEFDEQWNIKMVPRYGSIDTPINSDWGPLTRDQIWDKLQELYGSCRDYTTMTRYMAWINHLKPPVPPAPPAVPTIGTATATAYQDVYYTRAT